VEGNILPKKNCGVIQLRKFDWEN